MSVRTADLASDSHSPRFHPCIYNIIGAEAGRGPNVVTKGIVHGMEAVMKVHFLYS